MRNELMIDFLHSRLYSFQGYFYIIWLKYSTQPIFLSIALGEIETRFSSHLSPFESKFHKFKNTFWAPLVVFKIYTLIIWSKHLKSTFS